MAINTKPIFTGTPRISWFNYGGTDLTKISVITANNDFTTVGGITSSPAYRIFQAHSVYGSYVQKIRFRPLGTNVATVARIWIGKTASLVSGPASDSTLYDELSLPGFSSATGVAANNHELPLNFALPPSYTIYVTLGTSVASGFSVCVIGGDYSQ